MGFIFCISPGRSGTKYLSQLLDTAEEVVAFHEKRPLMSGKYLELIINHPYEYSYQERMIKVDQVVKDSKHHIYAETNNMYIKTFFDVTAHLNPKVIILKRPIKQILKSFMELDFFGEKNNNWKDWLTPANAITAAKSVKNFNSLSQINKCIAHLLDIEARTERFKIQYPNIETYEVSLNDLNSNNKVAKLFNKLDITPTKKTTNIIGNKINERKVVKRKISNNITLQECERALNEYALSI